MAHSDGDASLPRHKRSFMVKASPFNAVKLDVALIVIIGLVLALIHERLVSNPLGQLTLLGGYGVVAMCWIVVRTRRISRRLVLDQAPQSGGEE